MHPYEHGHPSSSFSKLNIYFSWPTHSTTDTSRPIHATDGRDGIATNFHHKFQLPLQLSSLLPHASRWCRSAYKTKKNSSQRMSHDKIHISLTQLLANLHKLTYKFIAQLRPASNSHNGIMNLQTYSFVKSTPWCSFPWYQWHSNFQCTRTHSNSRGNVNFLRLW